MLASDTATAVFKVFRDIARYDTSGNGPLRGKLTPDQQTFLQGKLTELDAAIQVAQTQQSINGINQKRVDEITIQQADRQKSAETLVHDILDVNAAEAVSKLSLDQTALQASYRVISNLSQLSLTKFL